MQRRSKKMSKMTFICILFVIFNFGTSAAEDNGNKILLWLEGMVVTLPEGPWVGAKRTAAGFAPVNRTEKGREEEFVRCGGRGNHRIVAHDPQQKIIVLEPVSRHTSQRNFHCERTGVLYAIFWDKGYEDLVYGGWAKPTPSNPKKPESVFIAKGL
jgi:hypothetical protein